MIRFALNEYSKRPIINYKINKTIVSALIDTVTMLPVFCGSYKNLLRYFPNSVLLADKVTIITGFGGDKSTTSTSDICKIPLFQITDGKEVLSYKMLYIALKPEMDKYAFKFILSASMFYKIDNYFVTSNNKRYWQLEPVRDSYQVIPEWIGAGKSLLKDIDILSQDIDISKIKPLIFKNN